MKIFVKNYNLFNIKKIIHLLDKYLVNKTNYYDVFSTEGHFTIDNNNIYKINHIDACSKIYTNYAYDFSIIVDNSISNKIETSQLPVDSIILPITILQYSLEKSKLKLLIQMSNDSEESILDFYFEINEEIDVNNIFIISNFFSKNL